MSPRTPVPVLMNEAQVYARIAGLYDAMLRRCRPQYWKGGKAKGRLRRFGIEALPFSRRELFNHVYAQVGPGLIPCPYCAAIGKPTNLIDLRNCVLDHKVPLDALQSDRDIPTIFALDNIVAVCADCNNLKGKLSYIFFVALLTNVYQWPNPRDRNHIFACLRTHGVSMRRGFGREKRPQQDSPGPPAPKQLVIEEPW